MARRGPKPKPSKVLELEGAYDIHPHRRREREPDAPDDWPDMPEHLDETAQAAWQDVCFRLDALGMLSHVYSSAIECYAQTYSNYRKAEAMVAKLGIALVTKNRNGEAEAKRNPFAVELHKYRDALLRYEVEFGLTPSSKSRLVTERTPSLDERERTNYGVVG